MQFVRTNTVPGGREEMIRMRFATKGILFTALVLFCITARPAAVHGQQAADQGKTSYTIPEYNAFQAARAETNAQNRIKLLDDFVTKFPSSTLMTYVNQLYVSTYTELKNYPKVIETADKMLAMGDKLDSGTRLQILQTRVQVFPFAFNPKAPDAHDQLVKERDAAKEGADLLAKYPKPADSKLTDEQFAEQKKPGISFFDAAAGFADLQLKDFPAAIEAFKGATADNPKDAISFYREGLAYLGAAPPQSVDGFWALARAINLGVPDADKIKDYLRKAILVYEQPGCDTAVDAQLGELLTLAGTSGDRPATYTIPAAADLQKIAASSTILTVLTDLTAGGDKAKQTWLAICGAQFPGVVGKIIEVKQGQGFVNFEVFTGADETEVQNATTANMDVKVWTAAPPAGTPNAAQETPQPDVTRLAKDDGIRFSGAIVSYDPTPFLLHWDQVKVDPTTIPEKADAGKHHKVPAKQ
jgi:tetratricopeptide (TPR) repeat protein